MPEEYVTIAEHREFAKRIEDENNRQNHRLTNLEEAFGNINKLTVSVEKLAINMDRMVKEQENTSKRLTALEQEPAEKWKKFVWALFIAGVGAVAGMIFGKLI